MANQIHANAARAAINRRMSKADCDQINRILALKPSWPFFWSRSSPWLKDRHVAEIIMPLEHDGQSEIRPDPSRMRRLSAASELVVRFVPSVG